MYDLTLSYEQAYAASTAITTLLTSDAKLDNHAKIQLARWLKDLKTMLEEREDYINKLNNDYVFRDDEGQPIVRPNGQYVYTNPFAFNTITTAFLRSEQTIPIRPFGPNLTAKLKRDPDDTTPIIRNEEEFTLAFGTEIPGAIYSTIDPFATL